MRIADKVVFERSRLTVGEIREGEGKDDEGSRNENFPRKLGHSEKAVDTYGCRPLAQNIYLRIICAKDIAPAAADTPRAYSPCKDILVRVGGT